MSLPYICGRLDALRSILCAWCVSGHLGSLCIHAPSLIFTLHKDIIAQSFHNTCAWRIAQRTKPQDPWTKAVGSKRWPLRGNLSSCSFRNTTEALKSPTGTIATGYLIEHLRAALSAPQQCHCISRFRGRQWSEVCVGPQCTWYKVLDSKTGLSFKVI